MREKINSFSIKLLTLCLIALICVLPRLACAENEYSVPGRNYELPDESNYDYEKHSPVSAFSYGSSGLGILKINGAIETKYTYDNWTAFETTGSVSVAYNYSGHYQLNNPEDWYIDHDGSRWIRSYDLGFLSNMGHGCIMVESSRDGTNWFVEADPIKNFFTKENTGKDFLLCTIPEESIKDGMYYRVVVAYRFAKRTKTSFWGSEYDHKKCVEVYEFYISSNRNIETIHDDSAEKTKEQESESILVVNETKGQGSESIPVTNKAKEQGAESIPVVNQSATFYDVSDLKGRGLIDYTGMEPDYVNAIGFAAVYTEALLEKNPDFSNTPWVIPVYHKIDDSWELVDTIDHKSKIGIINQELSKENGKEYQGYLEFQEIDSGKRGFISVKNFVTVPYWELNVFSSAEKGYGIAEYKQSSKFTPVYKDGKPATIKKYAKVLLPARGTYYVSIMDRINYQILGIVFEKNNNKLEPAFVFFNKKDLSLVY